MSSILYFLTFSKKKAYKIILLFYIHIIQIYIYTYIYTYYIYIYIYIYSYLYLQQSARYLERLYLVLKKYSSIRLQVSCSCSHEVCIISDIWSKNKRKNMLYFINTKISFHVYLRCQKQFEFHFIFLIKNLFWCLQPLINSFLLFIRRLPSIKSMIYNFSRRHNLQ